MKKFVSVIFVILFLFITIFYTWRFASRKHDIPCPFWLQWLVEMDNPFTKSNKAEVIIHQSNIRPGMHVIDFGCGPGRLTIPLAEKIGNNGKVTAIDIQSKMLQRTKNKAMARNLTNIEFIQGKIGEGNLQLNQSDHAMLVTVLGEVPDRYAAMKDIYHALKPGGILTVTEVIFDPHFQRQATVLDLANQVGFKQNSIFGNWAAYSILLEKPIEA